MDTVQHAYRKDVWVNQPQYIEVWLEKDALSGIFYSLTREYGVTLVVGRGYNSWSALREAVLRFEKRDKPVCILYFGDFDPSGEDIVRALREGLDFFGISPEIEKVALTLDDVIAYDLPPDFTKKTDTRATKFIERYGDIAVELDALPLPVLQQRIKQSIEEKLDMKALEEIRAMEEKEREMLTMALVQRREEIGSWAN